MIAFDYNWISEMAGGRLMSKKQPWMYYSSNAVWRDELGNVTLHILTAPKDVKYWDNDLGKFVTYHPSYAVGLMRSEETFTHGTFTAEIQLPKGRNLWPSFWLVGDGRWPDNGEIDICEAYSDNRGRYFKPLLPKWKTCTNVHWLEDDRHKQAKACCVPWILQPLRPSENFIRYEVEWLPDSIKFYANGVRTRTLGSNVAKFIAYNRMNVIFNLWTQTEDFTLDMPMVVRNFKHEAL